MVIGGNLYTKQSKCNDDTKQKNRALRKKIQEQEKEIAKLKSELKTLGTAWSKTKEYIAERTENDCVVDLVKSHNKPKEISKKKPLKEFNKEEFLDKIGIKSNFQEETVEAID